MNFYICGSSGDASDSNSLTVVQKEESIQILHKLLDKQGSTGRNLDNFSEEEKKTIDLLIQLKILQIDSTNHVTLNFPFFTQADHKIMDKVVNKAAQTIVTKLTEKWDQINKLIAQVGLPTKRSHNERGFLVLGCIILDWQGLHWLSTNDVLVVTKPQPNGSRFLLIGSPHEVSVNTFKRYCFSSTHETVSWNYTVFGQAYHSRWVTPTIEMFIQQKLSGLQDIPSRIAKIIPRFVSTAIDQYLDRLGNLLASKTVSKKEFADDLNLTDEGIENLSNYLLNNGFIEEEQNEWNRSVLVLSPEDQPKLDALMSICKQLVVESIQISLPELKERYPQTTAGKHRVPFEEAMNEWWHEIFSRVIQLLIIEGKLQPSFHNQDTHFGSFIWSNSLELKVPM
ncbi:MAG: hypothetical protein ACFFE8_02515 [Candidatus Heimdallarchaeota archaeon]